MEGLMVNLVNIYGPATSPKRPQFYQRVSDFLSTLDSHECLVLGGDFNTTLEEQDRSGAELSPAAANILREIVEHHSLVDVWRDHHLDDTSTFTPVRVEAHWSHRSRLDRIYLSLFHLSQAHSSNIRPAPFSNHHLATITASLLAERPGPAYWHFNNSLLEDEGFVTSFHEFWLAWRVQRHAFPSAQRWLHWTLTEPVSFRRGVRQGCRLSGQLYALVIEPFLFLLRRKLTGLVLQEPELRLVLSAYV
ncbi:unnamed protein product [Caretta caretta]